MMLQLKKNPYWTILTLSAICFGICLWLTYIHVRSHLDPFYDTGCAVGSFINCESVVASQFSLFLNLPVSIWAAVFYLVLSGLVISTLVRKNNCYNAGIIAGVTLFSALGSLCYLYITIFIVKALCIGCISIHFLNFLAAAIALIHLRSCGGFSKVIQGEISSIIRDRWTLINIFVLVLLFVIAGPLGGFPRYWETASWRGGPVFSTGFELGNLPWIGAAKPSTVVHEFFDYECPACRSSHKKLRRLLSSRSDRLRVVRHDMSRVECIGENGNLLKDRCISPKAAYCAGAQNQFWEFNDAFIADPKPMALHKRRTHVLSLIKRLNIDFQVFLTCLDDSQAATHVQGIHEDGLKRGIQSTPTYLVNGRKMRSKELMPLIQSL